MSGSETAQRIMVTALELINSLGAGAITTRSIAEKAGVNVAAVNYHFGSRENLVSKALDMTLSHLFEDWDMILGETSLELPERIYFFLDYMMEGIARYPGITRSFIFDPVVGDHARQSFSRHLQETVDSVSEGSGMRLALAQAVCSVLSAAILPEVTASLTGGDILREEARREYLVPMVNRVPGLHIEVTEEFLNRMAGLRKIAFKE